MEYSYEEFKAATKTLKVLPLSNYEDIKRRYKELSKKHHPDKGGDSEEFHKITNAYEILKEYSANFRFDLSKEEFFRQKPAEKLKEQFYTNPN